MAVVIRNDGAASVVDAFWVNLYIGLDDANLLPSGVNDIWEEFIA